MARGHRTGDDFAEAALAIALETGWASLTPATLSRRLGVHATAVYRHFASWNDVVVAAFDLSLAQLFSGAMEGLAAETSPRERILAFMRTVRAAADDDPNLADCVLAILRMGRPAPAPNFDAASAQIAGLLMAMGVPPSALPAIYQAIESLIIGSVIVDYTGHPHHISNRRQRRRMSGVAQFESFTRSDESTKAVTDEAFELSARLLLDECERLASQ